MRRLFCLKGKYMSSITGLQKDRTSRTIKIENQMYKYKMLPALVGFDVFAKLIEILGPTIGSAIDGMAKAEYILPDESTFWSELMIHLSRSLSAVKLSEIAEVVLFEVYINSGPAIDINEHFTGNITAFKTLLMDALKENFGELFLEALRARGLEIHTWEDLKNLTNPVPNTSESQNESNENQQ